MRYTIPILFLRKVCLFMFLFIFIFIFLIVIFRFYCHKHTAHQEQVIQDFWDKEQQANNVRKQDITGLEYVTLSADLIPGTLHTEEEEILLSLIDKKMLDLTDYTNTDLKLKYGAANLDELSQCEQNYVTMIRQLPIYARQLFDAGYTDEAKKLLEFGLSLENNSGSIYNTFKELYQSQDS